MLQTDYIYWNALTENPYQYQNEKMQLAKEVITALKDRFPQVSGKVEAVDVATPLTFERYTGNWKSAYEGWLPTTENYGKNFKTTFLA
jgi:hypothetical protein